MNIFDSKRILRNFQYENKFTISKACFSNQPEEKSKAHVEGFANFSCGVKQAQRSCPSVLSFVDIRFYTRAPFTSCGGFNHKRFSVLAYILTCYTIRTTHSHINKAVSWTFLPALKKICDNLSIWGDMQDMKNGSGLTLLNLVITSESKDYPHSVS